MELLLYLIVISIPFLALSPWALVVGVPGGSIFVGLFLIFFLFLMVNRYVQLKWVTIRDLPLALPLLIFIVTNIVSLCVVAYNRGISSINTENLKDIAYLIFASMFYIAIVSFADTREKVEGVAKAFIGTTAITSLYCIIKLLLYMMGSRYGAGQEWTVPRLIAPGGESQVFGSLAISILPLAVAGIMCNIAAFRNKWHYWAATTILLALVMTYSAGAWAGFGIAGIGLLIFVGYYDVKKIGTVLLMFVIVAGAAILISKTIFPGYLQAFTSITYKVVGFVPDAEKFKNRGTYETLKQYNSSGNSTDSAKYLESIRSKAERSWFRAALWGMFKSSPITGVGPGNFGELYDKFRPPGSERPPYVPKPHNQYLEILAETGIIGFTAFLNIIINLFFLIMKKWDMLGYEVKKLVIGLGGCLIAVGIHGYSFGVLVHIQVWLMLGLLVASLFVGTDWEENNFKRRNL